MAVEPGYSGFRQLQPLPRSSPCGLDVPLAASGRRSGYPESPRISTLGSRSPESKLLQRVTMGRTQADVEGMEELGYQEFLERQLDPEALDDGDLESAIAEYLPTTLLSARELFESYGEEPWVPALQLEVATLFRAVYSSRQLLQRLVVFWTDHFNVDLFGDLGPFLKPVDDREVVRAHSMGTFPDLLKASARSAAMLVYLNNDTNYRGHPNENYARELLELHTLGVDGGYSQQDVEEVARCFTGWTIARQGVATGEFVFNPAAHDTGPKKVLGHSLPPGRGVEDGEEVLEILAGHSSTSHFIAGKLVRFFWGYEPPRSLTRKVAKTYRRTGGDIRSMLRVILDPQRMETAAPKLKRPLHLFTSALRALFAEVGEPYWLLEQLVAAGHLPFAWSPPNGYPDDETYWSDQLLPRWNFASLAVEEKLSGIVHDLPFLDPGKSSAELVSWIDWLLLDGEMTERTREGIEAFLDNSAGKKGVRQALGMGLASPEFQYY